MSYIYLAAPFFNAGQLETVIFVEEWLRYANAPFYSPREDGVLKDMSPEDRRKNSKRIFELNIRKIIDCCGMIAVVDDKDTGTTFEMGYAYGSWAAIVTFSRRNSAANLMLAHATSGHLRGEDELRRFASQLRDTKKVGDQWFYDFCNSYAFRYTMEADT